MSYISNYINKKSNRGEKVLSVFLTSGFPVKEKFIELALNIFDAGADILEIGFPFSDPLADGPTIQYSSQIALENGITLKDTFQYVEKIRTKTDKPIVLMGYANPVLNYGINNFADDCEKTGVNGLIIPDVPIDEYENFYNNSFKKLEIILLATPTTSEERIKKIDELSQGFLYYVSMTGTTGKQVSHSDEIIEPLKRTASLVKKNRMLVGFGISSPDDIKLFSPYCSGVIVGSAVIKSLMNENGSHKKTIDLVKDLKKSFYTQSELTNN